MSKSVVRPATICSWIIYMLDTVEISAFIYSTGYSVEWWNKSKQPRPNDSNLENMWFIVHQDWTK